MDPPASAGAFPSAASRADMVTAGAGALSAGAGLFGLTAAPDSARVAAQMPTATAPTAARIINPRRRTDLLLLEPPPVGAALVAAIIPARRSPGGAVQHADPEGPGRVPLSHDGEQHGRTFLSCCRNLRAWTRTVLVDRLCPCSRLLLPRRLGQSQRGSFEWHLLGRPSPGAGDQLPYWSAAHLSTWYEYLTLFLPA